MIDMTLLPEPWRSQFVAVCAMSEGESFGDHRRTLRIGDLLLRRKEYRQVNADGGACSMSAPRPPDALLVGRDVFDEKLYPDLWADWRWDA